MQGNQITEPSLKGTTVLSFKKWINAKVHEGYFDELVLQSGLTDKKMILPSSWYPAEKYKRMIEIAGKSFGKDVYEFTGEFSEFMIENDLNNVYKFLIRAAKPKMVLPRLTTLDDAYNNYCTYKTVKNEMGSYQGEAEIPENLSRFHLSFMRTGIQKVLEICKATVIRYEIKEEETIVKEGKKYLISRVYVEYTV